PPYGIAPAGEEPIRGEKEFNILGGNIPIPGWNGDIMGRNMGVMGRGAGIRGRARWATAPEGAIPSRAGAPSTTENQTFLTLHLLSAMRAAISIRSADRSGPAAGLFRQGGDLLNQRAIPGQLHAHPLAHPQVLPLPFGAGGPHDPRFADVEALACSFRSFGVT